MPININLSDHFSFYRLTDSQTHPDLVILNRQRVGPYLPALTQVCQLLLEPLMKRRGVLNIHSGFRCPELNKAVGGSDTSQHCLGQAADFDICGRLGQQELLDDLNWIWKDSGLKWHQLLLERECLHISLPTGANDMQVAYAIKDPQHPGQWIKTQLA